MAFTCTASVGTFSKGFAVAGTFGYTLGTSSGDMNGSRLPRDVYGYVFSAVIASFWAGAGAGAAAGATGAAGAGGAGTAFLLAATGGAAGAGSSAVMIIYP